MAPHAPPDRVHALDLRPVALGRGLGAMRPASGEGPLRLVRDGANPQRSAGLGRGPVVGRWGMPMRSSTSFQGTPSSVATRRA